MPRIPSYPLIGQISNNDLMIIDDVSQQYATKSVELQSLKGYFNTGQATTTYVDDKVVSGALFNTDTGVLTLTRTDGVDVTEDLDGRYALTSSLATVATSGSYNDLNDTPTIPAAYTNADVDTHLNKDAQTQDGYVLSLSNNDYTWVAQSGGGGGVTSIIAGEGIGIDQSVGDVTIINTGPPTGGYTTLTRTISGNELVNAFNGTAGDEIILVTVPAGYQAVLLGDAIAYQNYNSGTTDYAGSNLNLQISTGISDISLFANLFTNPAYPFYITNGQTDINNALPTTNLGQNIILETSNNLQRPDFTAGDRDIILSFTYRLININL